MDKRWQMVLDCLGAEHPPFSQGTLFNFRMRLIAHNVDKTLLDRTVALAEKTGGFGARQLRAVLDSTPLVGAGRVEDTLNLLGHALRKAVGLAAHILDASAEAVAEDAGLTLLGHSSLKAALDLDWGEPSARERALGLVLEEVGRWQRWLEQQHTWAAQDPPIKEVMETITQIIAQDTEPDPDGELGGKRIKKHVAPDRRISIEDKDMRHGRKSSSKTFNGFKEHFAVDLDSNVTREVVVRPANEPEHAVVELLAEELEKAPGLLQLDVDLGYMASPRIAQWAAQGVYIIAYMDPPWIARTISCDSSKESRLHAYIRPVMWKTRWSPGLDGFRALPPQHVHDLLTVCAISRIWKSRSDLSRHHYVTTHAIIW
jgi:hypothetical protein